MNHVVQTKDTPSKRDILCFNIDNTQKAKQCNLTGLSFTTAIVTNYPGADSKCFCNVFVCHTGLLNTVPQKQPQPGIFPAIRIHNATSWPTPLPQHWELHYN